MSRPAAVPW